MFHATHFIIERRREALLWSWIVAKWGGKGEGHLDEDLKNGMWEELGGISEEQEVILDNLRVTREDDVDTNMRLAGLAPPRAEDPTASATTEYWFGGLVVLAKQFLSHTSLQSLRTVIQQLLTVFPYRQHWIEKSA